jgi:DNA-binding CsgD family transcriptional regulator
MPAGVLLDRSDECQVLDVVLDTVLGGMSGTLVIRGEPGIGKTALLEYVAAAAAAAGFEVVRQTGIESEMELGFAALHQLLVPFQPGLGYLPEPQRDALGSAFGLVDGGPPDRFLVGLAALTLLAQAAQQRPVLGVIDDAQWLDQESAEVLAFVARRLHADRIGFVFAVRDPDGRRAVLDGLPELRLGGLPDADARRLLASVAAGPVAPDVGDRIVAETRGNPLALAEIGGELSAGQLAGGSLLPQPLPLGDRLRERFLRQVRTLPADTQRLLLLAAAERLGDAGLLWRAAGGMGIDDRAADPAEAGRLLVVGPEVRFRHPLIRSAVYHGAAPVERRAVHLALAAALDPERDPDRRAWHRAAAAAGPDEEVATELARSAERAAGRGGYATMAAFLERAAALTSDPQRQAERLLAAAEAELIAGDSSRAQQLLKQAQPQLRNALSQAGALRLEGGIQFALGEGGKAPATLLNAARAFETAGAPRPSRDAMLEALEAAFYASRTAILDVARAAEALPPAPVSPPSAADLLLDGFTTLLTTGHTQAAPLLRRAMEALGSDDIPADEGLRWLGLGCWAAAELVDEQAWHTLASRWVQLARDRGALMRLPTALDYLGEWAVRTGHFAAATASNVERHEILAATGNPELIGTAAVELALPAWKGSDDDARSAASAVTRYSSKRGQGVGVSYAQWALAVLELGFAHYEAAKAHALTAYQDDMLDIGTLVLPDLIEAAARSGDRKSATGALERLTPRALAGGTEFGKGLLARSRALLADDEAAEILYQEAIGCLGRTRSGLDLARAHLLYGEWLRRQRRRLDARRQLRTAHQMLESMGAGGLAERARRELLATGEKARQRTSEPDHQLTPREDQIARLVCQGLSNPAVAAQLFISPSTVEYHLRKVFRKLGVSTRTQLARRYLPMTGDAQRPALPVADPRER